MKRLYGKTTINENDCDDVGKGFFINLRYYKTRTILAKPDEKRYGIEIIKKEVNGRNRKKEKSVEKYISNSEQVIEKLLKILIKNKVTPIQTNDILSDFRKSPELIYILNGEDGTR